MPRAHAQAGPGMMLALWRVRHSHDTRDSFSRLHTPSSSPGAGRILVQEGSAKLGSGHEDTVGQEEVAEECLCRAGTGDRWGASAVKSTEHKYMHSWSIPFPNPTTDKGPEMPNPCHCTSHPSQEHRNANFPPADHMDQTSTR